MSAGRTAAIVFSIFLAYAVARYHLFKGVPWSRLPLYTVNKTLAMAAIAMVALSLLRSARARRRGPGDAGAAPPAASARSLGVWGAGFAICHSAASLALLNPAYFPEFFGADKGFTTPVELSLATGAAALAIFLILALPGGNETDASGANAGANAGAASRRSPRVAIGALLIAVHCAAIGLPKWLDPVSWPGAMPPLTLIGFLLSAFALALAVRGRRP